MWVLLTAILMISLLTLISIKSLTEQVSHLKDMMESHDDGLKEWEEPQEKSTGSLLRDKPEQEAITKPPMVHKFAIPESKVKNEIDYNIDVIPWKDDDSRCPACTGHWLAQRVAFDKVEDGRHILNVTCGNCNLKYKAWSKVNKDKL